MALIKILLVLSLTGCGTHVLITQKICKKNDYQLSPFVEDDVVKRVSKRFKTPIGNFKKQKISVNELFNRGGQCESRREFVSIEVEDDLWSSIGQFVPLFSNQKINSYLLKIKN